jgi:hypothetical protein
MTNTSNTVKVSIYLTPEQARQLEQAAALEDRPVSQLVRRVLVSHLSSFFSSEGSQERTNVPTKELKAA